MISAIEHVIGRNLNHPTATLLYCRSQIAWCIRIQQTTEFLIVFCLINSGIGSTVHDTINMVFIHKSIDGSSVGNIQLCHICIKIGMLGINLLQQLHLIS